MIVGFHVQQAIEKLIKAVLSDNQITYPHVNDLDRLLRLLETEQITQPATRRDPNGDTAWPEIAPLKRDGYGG